MRKGESDIEDVAAQFAAWRAMKQGRRIPAELWRAALGLLSRYTRSAVCRRLRLNASRLAQVREAGVSGLATVPQWRRLGQERRDARRRRPTSQATIRAGRAFMELPGLGVTVGAAATGGHTHPAAPEPGGFRLVVEGATGTVIVVTRASDDGLVDAVCRVVLGVLGGGGA